MKRTFWCRIGLHKWRCVHEAIFYGWDYECERPNCTATHYDPSMG
jgi:hypothetical protein